MFLRDLERRVLEVAQDSSVSDIYKSVQADASRKKRTLYNTVGFLEKGGYLSKRVVKPRYGEKSMRCYYSTTKKGQDLLREDKEHESLIDLVTKQSRLFVNRHPFFGGRANKHSHPK